MTRRRVGWVVGGVLLIIGLLVWAAERMCACTPGMSSVVPPADVVAALASVDSEQQRHYIRHGLYNANLENLKVPLLSPAWDPVFNSATAIGYDLSIRSHPSGVVCSHVAVRGTDATVARPRTRCWAVRAAPN